VTLPGGGLRSRGIARVHREAPLRASAICKGSSLMQPGVQPAIGRPAGVFGDCEAEKAGTDWDSPPCGANAGTDAAAD